MAKGKTKKSKINRIILLVGSAAFLLLTVTVVLLFVSANQAVGEKDIIHAKDEVINELESRLDRVQKDLQLLREQSYSDKPNAANTEKVKEAYFLARLAEDRLQYANDVPTAKRMLEIALSRVESLDNSYISSAKKIIKNDIERLSGLNYPQNEQMLEKLSQMDKMIEYMVSKDIDAPSSMPTGTNIDQSWANLKNLISIRKKSEVDIDLSHVNTEINKAQFRLLIEQLRWAVFYRDTVIYERSIQRAQYVLERAFDQGDEKVREFSLLLSELSTIKIQPDIPSIHNSANVLLEILEEDLV